MNILECTIKMKQETQAHYERLVEVAGSDELKRLFTLMAAAEGEHIEKLAGLKKEMAALNMDATGTLEERVCVYSPHMDLRHLADILRNDPDAYRHIEQDEEETIEFFSRLGDQADSNELKEICRMQAAKEREHLVMLENIYSFVEDPRTYLEWGEFSNLKSL